MDSHVKILYKLAKLIKGDTELRKEIVYKGDTKQYYVTVYSAELETAKVNYQLRKISIEERFHVKYVFFKNNNSNKRVSGLKHN